MIKSIRHLRGTESEWAQNDCVIPNAEIAILNTAGGKSKMKIGNGKDRFSELPFTDVTVVSKDAGETILEDKRLYRLKMISEVYLILPQTPDEDFYCEISFDTGEDETVLNFNRSVYVTGDGAKDGVLIPTSKTHYTLAIWYDGSFQACSRGIPRA